MSQNDPSAALLELTTRIVRQLHRAAAAWNAAVDRGPRSADFVLQVCAARGRPQRGAPQLARTLRLEMRTELTNPRWVDILQPGTISKHVSGHERAAAGDARAASCVPPDAGGGLGMAGGGAEGEREDAAAAGAAVSNREFKAHGSGAGSAAKANRSRSASSRSTVVSGWHLDALSVVLVDYS